MKVALRHRGNPPDGKKACSDDTMRSTTRPVGAKSRREHARFESRLRNKTPDEGLEGSEGREKERRLGDEPVFAPPAARYPLDPRAAEPGGAGGGPGGRASEELGGGARLGARQGRFECFEPSRPTIRWPGAGRGLDGRGLGGDGETSFPTSRSAEVTSYAPLPLGGKPSTPASGLQARQVTHVALSDIPGLESFRLGVSSTGLAAVSMRIDVENVGPMGVSIELTPAGSVTVELAGVSTEACAAMAERLGAELGGVGVDIDEIVAHPGSGAAGSGSFAGRDHSSGKSSEALIEEGVAGGASRDVGEERATSSESRTTAISGRTVARLAHAIQRMVFDSTHGL